MNLTPPVPIPAPEPIIVNPSVVPDVTNTIVRDIAIVAASLPIVVKLIGARDLNGILHWMQSSDGAVVLAIIVPVLLTFWRAARAKLKKATLVQVARVVSDDVAVVTEPTPPPRV